MSQFFPVDKLIIAALLVALILWVLHDCYHAWQERICSRAWPKVRWSAAATAAAVMLLLVLALLTGCTDTINPVRYQPVEVLVTKPCLAGRNPPPEAQTRIAVACDGKDCTLKCSDTRPEECAKHMAADIIELQREARESRSLIKECSK